MNFRKRERERERERAYSNRTRCSLVVRVVKKSRKQQLTVHTNVFFDASHPSVVPPDEDTDDDEHLGAAAPLSENLALVVVLVVVVLVVVVVVSRVVFVWGDEEEKIPFCGATPTRFVVQNVDRETPGRRERRRDDEGVVER